MARREIRGAPMPAPRPRAILPVEVRDVGESVVVGESGSDSDSESESESEIGELELEGDDLVEDVMLKFADVQLCESASMARKKIEESLRSSE